MKYPSRVARDIAIRRMARDGIPAKVIARQIGMGYELVRKVGYGARYSRYFRRPLVTQRGTP